jgi:CubicO group peptidase (beta-lactamase class C family)
MARDGRRYRRLAAKAGVESGAVKRLVLLAAALALASSAAVRAQRPPAWAAQADAIFADVATPDAPGCALAVFRDGHIAYERGYGLADLEHDVPITPASVFYVGSLSKQFTAFALTLAAADGKLSIDDDVRKWIPELPDYGVRLTVRHLLHHTSGLRDYNTLLDIAGRRNDEAFDNRIVLGIIARQRALNFPPGDQYLYSNSGYVLLSLVVERATGTPLAEYAKRRIFEPLGMRDTQFYDDVTRVVKNRAFAYERTNSGLRDDTPHSQRTGAGGLLTTVRDLLAWDNNFHEPKVGTKALIAEMQQPGALASGKPLTYARGLEIGAYRGLPIVEHGGSLGGYRAHLIRFPDARTSIACLCNFGTSDPGGRAHHVADVVLADRFTSASPSRTTAGSGNVRAASAPVTLTPAQIGEYVGRYVSEELDTTFAFDVDGGTLRLKRERDPAPVPLDALALDRFRFRGMVIRFLRENGGGRVTGLAVDAGRVENIRFTAASPTRSSR